MCLGIAQREKQPGLVFWASFVPLVKDDTANGLL
jgi:hypothetical protein